MSETDPQCIFRLPLSTLSKTTLLSSLLYLFLTLSSLFPPSPHNFPFTPFGSQALGFPAGWRRAGVLNVGNKVVEYMSKLCATVTKILNRDNLGKGFLLTQVLTLSAFAIAPIAFGWRQNIIVGDAHGGAKMLSLCQQRDREESRARISPSCAGVQ